MSFGSKFMEESLLDLKNKVDSVDKDLDFELGEIKVREQDWKNMDEEASKILNTNSNDIVRLNVSGKKFATTIATLLNIKDTLFYRLITSRKIDMTKELFLDRSPNYFCDLLDYMRYKEFHYRKYSEDQLDEIYFEAQYFEFTEIMDHLGER